jgi:hypothetical protein
MLARMPQSRCCVEQSGTRQTQRGHKRSLSQPSCCSDHLAGNHNMPFHHASLSCSTATSTTTPHRHVSSTLSAAACVPRHLAGHHAAALHKVQRSSDSRAVAVAVGRRELLGGLAPCCCCGSCVSNRREWYDKFFALSMVSHLRDGVALPRLCML